MLPVLSVGFFIFQLSSAFLEDTSDLRCVVTYDTWMAFDKIELSWDLDDVTLTDKSLSSSSAFNVTWYTRTSSGVCTEATMTSCTCNYLDNNCMSFYFAFQLNVTIQRNDKDIFRRSWIVDPFSCIEPPPIDNLSVFPVSSTCVNVSWSYGEESLCQFFPSVKLLRIGRRNVDDPSWLYSNINMTTELCQGETRVCSLEPYTAYEFVAQCAILDEGFPQTQYSNPLHTTTAVTLEDVPTGRPEMTDAGFVKNTQNCVDGEMSITLYWKDIPKQLKHGRITKFSIRTEYTTDENAVAKETAVPGDVFQTQLSVVCNQMCTIAVSAETLIGRSSNSSMIHINTSVADSGERIVIPQLTDYGFRVQWIVKGPQVQQSPVSTVVWCRKNLQGKCRSPIDWLHVGPDAQFADVHVNGEDTALHHYRLGVASPQTGITWSPCQYLAENLQNETDIPRRLSLSTPEAIPEGCFIVSWNNEPCESVLPAKYVAGFELHVCPVDTDMVACKEPTTVYTLDSDTNSYIVKDLDSSLMYRAKLFVVHLGEHKVLSAVVYGRPSMTYSIFHKAWFYAVIVIAGILAIMTTVGCICFARNIAHRIKRRIKKQRRITYPRSFHLIDTSDMEEDTVV